MKVRNLETGTGVQASVEQMKKALDQAQTEDNDIKLRIHTIEKESQNWRKDIAENTIFSVGLKGQSIIENQALKQEISELRRNSDSIMQENQIYKAKLERRINSLISSNIFTDIPKENKEMSRKTAELKAGS